MSRTRLCSASIVALAFAAAITAASAAEVTISNDITTSTTWTKDNVYILDKPIYVINGATLTIEAGTIVRGQPESGAGVNDPGTLIVSRDSKIQVAGTPTEPVVFTDLNDNNVGSNPGTAPYDTWVNAQALTARWGGLILLGRSYVANGTSGAPNANKEVQIEGLSADGGKGLYGNCAADAVEPDCDDDDSGSLRYLSIRYGGFNLSANNEINGLTMGAVGRSTDVNFVEVMNNKDDAVEFFGGTVSVKNLIAANGGDDGIDWDEGFRGKVQFALVLQGTPASDKSDKGGEWDGGNAPDNSEPLAIPTLYNVTMVGLGQKAYTDKAKNTAMHFRDNTGGRVYNSAFLDFGGAPMCIEGGSSSGTAIDTSGERSQTSYVQDNNFYLGPPSSFELELQDNEFWCFGNGGAVPTGDATASGCDSGKVHHDPGVFSTAALDNRYRSCADPLPIRALVRTNSGDPTRPDFITTLDPVPPAGSVLATTNRTISTDGFVNASYKGAFAPGGSNWARGWSALDRLGLFPAPPRVVVSADITTSQTWTAGNEYELENPIYVTNGATLTIEPGTIVRGQPESAAGANDPGTLIVSRDSKINAVGTLGQPIVFTDLQDSNVGADPGVAPYDTLGNSLALTARWGGLILLGRTYVANGTGGAANPAKEVQIEGLSAEGGKGLYGNCTADAAAPLCDDDDSGNLGYVSIRYGGFNLSANNEINGLTMGAVGRNTDVNFVEITNNKDDAIEFFGGTVSVKNLIAANGGDDGIDWDEGFRGKVQYALVLQGTPAADKSDKGGEWDGGNAPDNSEPRAIPTLYNVTMVGLGQKAYTDKAKNTAMHFRDNTGGRVYNSAFLDFGGAPLCIEGGSSSGTAVDTSGARAQAAYVVDTNFYRGPGSTYELELQDNEFWCFGNGGAVPTGDATANGCDSGKVHHDPGVFSTAALDNRYRACADPLPIRTLTRTNSGDPSKPDIVTAIDPRPAPGSVLATSNRILATDGFEPAAFKGAFAPGQNWAAGWTTLSRVDYFPTCVPGAVDVAPDSAQGLTFTTKTAMQWNDVPFGNLYFDVLRSGSPSNFSLADCIETNDTGTGATDAAVPATNAVFYYLVRSENACAEGSLGQRYPAGTERSGAACDL